jgi:hypothetical protein
MGGPDSGAEVAHMCRYGRVWRIVAAPRDVTTVYVDLSNLSEGQRREES